MATTDFPSEQLYALESSIHGQVVLITYVDFAGGIEELAFELAKRGAKVVGTRSIPNYRGEDPDDMEMPYYKNCNVNDWDSQVSLFRSAESEFGGVDIVAHRLLSSYGVHFDSTCIMAFSDVEYICDFTTLAVDENGRPTKPDLIEIQSNLISVIYTTRLALHYLNRSPNPDSLKRIIFRTAPNTLAGIESSLYRAAKHGVLGFMRALRDDVQIGDIQVSAVAWSNSQEKPEISFILGAEPASLFIGGVFLAATDTDDEANGAIYDILDDFVVRRTAHVPSPREPMDETSEESD